MRPLSCLALAVWLLSVPAAAQPAPLPLELSWQAPSECPTAADVHAELARIASAAPGEDLRPLTANIEVTRSAGRYTARMHTEHEGLAGERTLQADDCATLTRSITLVLALAFGRSVQLRDTTASPTAEPTPPPTQAATAPLPVPVPLPDSESESDPASDPDAPSSTSPLRFTTLLGAGAQLTLMPRVAPLFTLGASLELSALSFELRASLLPGTSEPIDTRIGARALVDGFVGTALACAHVALADFCAGGRGGAIRARSRGLFETGERIAPWYALAIAAGLRWPEQSALQVSLEALLAISLTRPRYEVTGYGVAHRVPLLAPELSAFLRLTP